LAKKVQRETVLAFFIVVAIGQIFPPYFANLEFFLKKNVFELFNNFYNKNELSANLRLDL
jgi:hypothetical protein